MKALLALEVLLEQATAAGFSLEKASGAACLCE